MALEDKLKDLNRYRDQRIARTAASVLPTFAAQRQGGSLAARAVAESFHPKQPSVDKVKVADQKRRIIDSMADLTAKVRTGDLGLAEALSKQGDYIKEMLGFASSVYGARSGALASTQNSVNSAVATIAGDEARFIGEAAKQQLGAAAGRGGKAFDELMGLIGGAGAGGIEDPRFAQIAAQQLATLPPGPAAEFAAYADAEIQRTQGPGADLQSVLQNAAQGGDVNARQALVKYDQIQGQAADINRKALITGMAALNGKVGQLAQSALGSKEAVDLFKQLVELPVLSSSPEDMKQRMEDVFGALPDDANKATIDQYLKLLDAMDTDTPPANVEQARRMLFASKEFQDFKRENNLESDAMALRLMRQNLRDKSHAQKQRDRQVLAAQRQGLEAPDATKIGNDDLVSQGEKKQPTSDEDPTFVRSKDGKLYIYDPADGSFGPASDEDRERLAKSALDPEIGSAILDSIQKADRFDEFQQKADQSRSKSLIDDARARAGGKEAVVSALTPKVKTTPSAVSSEVGYSLTHPEYAAKQIGSAFGDMLKKRKKSRKAAEDAMSRGIGAGMRDTGMNEDEEY